jgi:LPS-assembly lipoprotein
MPLALAACGFAPAYAPGGGADRLVGTVWVQDPSDKNGFDLVERLEERLGRPRDIRYDLAYTITTEAVGVGITTDNKITRFNLKGVIDYTLTERASGARIAVAGCKASPPIPPPARLSRALRPRKTPRPG